MSFIIFSIFLYSLDSLFAQATVVYKTSENPKSVINWDNTKCARNEQKKLVTSQNSLVHTADCMQFVRSCTCGFGHANTKYYIQDWELEGNGKRGTRRGRRERERKVPLFSPFDSKKRHNPTSQAKSFGPTKSMSNR